MMKKIALIYMGGTFGCVGEPLSPMPAEQFLPRLAQVLPLNLDIECFVAPVIKDSSACTAVDWLLLIQYIQQLQQQDFQHFVILHGTDTISYASAVLARFLTHSTRVILTGSQYPLLNVQGTDTREFSDALDNLNFALAQIHQVNSGVYLAFHHQLIHAATALKQHTTELNAFTGQSALACSEILPYDEPPLSITAQHIEKAQHFNCLNWMLQPIALSALIQNLKALQQHPPHCLILQSYGTGNMAVNAEVIALIHALQSQQCAVILTTQVTFGAIEQRYAISQWLQDSKILISNCHSHADLYAKALKMHLQYDSLAQWYAHWHSSV
ncbi:MULTISPECIES: asparaginase domain-containing protein [Acinetobacter]|uniref:asparaginase domain-containing protein n=1 Tax=Acinetobacter TaxID=469 RepID=UPI0015D30BCC|nr:MULTISPECIES: asparaginase domain-containing protein [Acinetobacter]MBF4519641.1 asparaginase [Acinetobacter towneri]MCO8047774.1 asparaginase domain-containing protein [Acinetobacter towneri]